MLVAYTRRFAPGVELRVVGYEKDAVPEMLDRGEMDVALGVFPSPPQRAVIKPLFEERFVGIARADHPAIRHGSIDAPSFAGLPHALVTLRRDATGALDEALAKLGLKRQVVLTMPYALALPAVLQASDLVAAVASRQAARMLSDGAIQQFDLPVATPAWTVSMLWSASSRNDRAAAWLREAMATCAKSA